MDKELAVVMGNAACQARQARHLTQDQVAKLLGVSVEFYSRLERGRAHPSIETFLRMLDVLARSFSIQRKKRSRSLVVTAPTL